MAPGERHTPCHDVIQGTCQIRRSGPFLGPSLLVCVVDNDYFSSLLLRAQPSSSERRMTPQPSVHHLTIALAAASQKHNPRAHLPVPNKPITHRPPWRQCALTTHPRARLDIYRCSPLPRYRWII